jgi:hypothetical protein
MVEMMDPLFLVPRQVDSSTRKITTNKNMVVKLGPVVPPVPKVCNFNLDTRCGQ